MPKLDSRVSVSFLGIKLERALKQPDIFSCHECFYIWYSKSLLEKPTCPACKSHNTKKGFISQEEIQKAK